MGTFTVQIEIGDLSNSHFAHTEAMVDTGAVYTMVPEDLIAGLTLISPETREFVLADESKVEYTVGYLRIRFEEKEVFALTIVAPEGTTARSHGPGKRIIGRRPLQRTIGSHPRQS